MSRNKLPTEKKKVRFMTIYVEPKFIGKLDKEQVNNFINQLQSEYMKKCADESLKNK